MKFFILLLLGLMSCSSYQVSGDRKIANNIETYDMICSHDNIVLAMLRADKLFVRGTDVETTRRTLKSLKKPQISTSKAKWQPSKKDNLLYSVGLHQVSIPFRTLRFSDDGNGIISFNEVIEHKDGIREELNISIDTISKTGSMTSYGMVLDGKTREASLTCE